MYKGVIIEESLTDISIIKELELLDRAIEKVTESENTPWLDHWTLDTVCIPEDKIKDYANRLSYLIETEHCSDWYCDFRSDKYHYVIFANKIFKLDINKKEDYMKMQDYARSIGLPEGQMPQYNNLPINLLSGFLIYAKKQTYANSEAPKINASRLGSNDYEYSEVVEGEKMCYHDTYFGGIKFMGEEVVYRGSDKPKWGMNYYGVTLDSDLSEEAMDKALRPALMQVGEDATVLPLRGPSRFENDGYVYTFKCTGTLESFEGEEEIYKDNKLIYRLNCHGGIIE